MLSSLCTFPNVQEVIKIKIIFKYKSKYIIIHCENWIWATFHKFGFKYNYLEFLLWLLSKLLYYWSIVSGTVRILEIMEVLRILYCNYCKSLLLQILNL